MNSVAAADVAAVVAGFQANNPPPTSVTKTQNADGTYTVVAQFPPCPADTTHATGS